MDIHVFESNSSKTVKMVTIGIIIGMALAVFGLVFIDANHGIIGTLIISLFIVAFPVYFYFVSLHSIIVDDKKVIIKKRNGQILLNLSEIEEVKRLSFSNLTMTTGSKGFFGYIGSTMDNSFSLVKDRRKMVRIKTKDKSYIISTEEPDKFVSTLNRLLNKHIKLN